MTNSNPNANLTTFLTILGPPLDPTTGTLYEDTFAVFSYRLPSKNLGFIDRSTSSLNLTINNHEFVVAQSPAILNSDRKGGTTGAVLWSLTPLLVNYLLSPNSFLHTYHILTPTSTVLELGSGSSSLIALSLTLSPPSTPTSSSIRPAGRIILSDQPYVLKLARQNLENNLSSLAPGRWECVRDETRPSWVSYRVIGAGAGARMAGPSGKNSRGGGRRSTPGKAVSLGPSLSHTGGTTTTIDLISLDWEVDSLHHHPAFNMNPNSDSNTNNHISLVLAIDCIYNEALIPPLINTCVDACLLSPSNDQAPPTVVMIALELRSPDVLEFFLETFAESFRVWRIPDEVLSKELKTGVGPDGEPTGEGKGSGYVIYCGILKENIAVERRK